MADILFYDPDWWINIYWRLETNKSCIKFEEMHTTFQFAMIILSDNTRGDTFN